MAILGPAIGQVIGPGVGIAGSASSSLLTDLVSWWSLDETTGTRSDDHGSNDLSEINTVGYTTGKHGNAADLVAANLEYLDDGGSNTGLAGRSTDFSIVTWANARTLPATVPTILSNATGSSTLDYSLLYNHGTARFEFYVNSGTTNYYAQASTFGAPSTSTWYMLYAEYNGDTDTIGISINNGTLDTGSGPTTPNSANTRFLIGAHYGAGRYWDGFIDETAFWSRRLTAAERTSLYNSGNGLAYPG